MIRRATSTDHDWIRSTAAAVYRDLGDYGTIIPSWLEHTGVLSFVDTAAGDTRRGFILVGFYTPDEITSRDDGGCVADLLAIAVAPEHQRQGVGTRLLAYALEVARAAAVERDVPEMRLTVSEDNTVARAMFVKARFRVLDGDYGNYDGGQRAIRMTRRIENS